MWINQGDIILIGLRDYQDSKADVILRYNPDEARNLKTYGELPETGNHSNKPRPTQKLLFIAKLNDITTFNPGEDDDDIFFDEEFEDEDDDAIELD